MDFKDWVPSGEGIPSSRAERSEQVGLLKYMQGAGRQVRDAMRITIQEVPIRGRVLQARGFSIATGFFTAGDFHWGLSHYQEPATVCIKIKLSLNSIFPCTFWLILVFQGKPEASHLNG